MCEVAAEQEGTAREQEKISRNEYILMVYFSNNTCILLRYVDVENETNDFFHDTAPLIFVTTCFLKFANTEKHAKHF